MPRIILDLDKIDREIQGHQRELDRLTVLRKSVDGLKKYVVTDADKRSRGRPKEINGAYDPIRKFAVEQTEPFTSRQIKAVVPGKETAVIYGAIEQLEGEGLIETVVSPMGRRVGVYKKREG